MKYYNALQLRQMTYEELVTVYESSKKIISKFDSYLSNSQKNYLEELKEALDKATDEKEARGAFIDLIHYMNITAHDVIVDYLNDISIMDFAELVK